MAPENNNTSFVSYNQTGFWFEMDFEVKDDQIKAIYDVNI